MKGRESNLKLLLLHACKTGWADSRERRAAARFSSSSSVQRFHFICNESTLLL
jgi:hypothetical protein